MCRSVHVGLLLVVALALTPSHSRAGIDRVYYKPEAAISLGERLADFVGYPGYQKSYALVVGISAYSGGYPDLPTQNDPIRMRDFLLNEAGFDYVHVITEEKVTNVRIRTLMEDDFPALIGENDRFLFYWSGHGIQRDLPNDSMRGYLPLASSSRKWGTMVSMVDIVRWDQNIAGKQVLYLVDACFSGLAGLVTKSESRALTIEQLAQPSRHLIVAGTGDEKTIAGDRWDGSIFTDSVLKGLRGAADTGTRDFDSDGVVSLHELIDYVKKQVNFEKVSAGWKKPITPQLRDLSNSVGEFFFLTGREKVADIDRSGDGLSDEYMPDEPVTDKSDLQLMAQLTISSHVTGATVYIDEQRKGPTGPSPFELAPGVHTVRLEAEQHASVEKTVMLEAGASETLRFDLPFIISEKPDPDVVGRYRVVVTYNRRVSKAVAREIAQALSLLGFKSLKARDNWRTKRANELISDVSILAHSDDLAASQTIAQALRELGIEVPGLAINTITKGDKIMTDVGGTISYALKGDLILVLIPDNYKAPPQFNIE
ncbi:MAG: caspase family protein [Gammaproteobacteria bacterium]|nr:caspase family protein [Gammaproteobacteria bacterium]